MSGEIHATARKGSAVSEMDAIIAMRAKGYPGSSIARMLGLHEQDVRAVMEAPTLQAVERSSICLPAPVIPKATVAPAPKRRGRAPSEIPPIARAIIHQVAAHYGCAFAEMVGVRGTNAIATIRQEAFWELRQLTTEYSTPRFSWQQIGRWFGRDHTTALWGAQQHQRRLDAAAMAMAAE